MKQAAGPDTVGQVPSWSSDVSLERADRRLGHELRRHRAAIGVGVVGGALLLSVGVATGAAGWPVYVVVLLAGAAAVTAVDLRVGLSRLTVWGLVIFALGHLAGGLVPVDDGVLYQQWLIGRVLRYDNVQHAWGWSGSPCAPPAPRDAPVTRGA
jgi:hypothetical protein